MAKREEKLSLEQILEQLDGTIEELQSGDVSLEESFEFYVIHSFFIQLKRFF